MTQEKNSISKQEKWGILLLFLLYFVQGLPLGFIGAINLLLIEGGLSYSELSLISLAKYPFTFKLFIAPFEDAIYSNKVGKRKTYVLPTQYLLGGMLVLLSYYLDDLLSSRSVLMFTAISFSLVLCAAVQDIAVDGWVLTLLEEKNSGWGSACQSIGQALGVLVSGTISIQLNSIKFCNDYIFRSAQADPVLPIKSFCWFSGIIIIALNICIHFFAKEKKVDSEKEIHSVIEVIKKMKGFYYNENLRKFILLDIAYVIPFAITSASSTKVLIENGMDKETISFIGGIFLFLSFIVSFLVQYFTRNGDELKQCYRAYVLRFINNILLYLFLVFIKELGRNTMLIFILILELMGTIQSYMRLVAGGGFRNRICDPSLGGSSLTFLNSMFNFGNFISTSVAFLLIEYVSFRYLAIIGWIFGGYLLFVLKKEFYRMDSLPKEHFALSFKASEYEKKRD